MNKRHLACCSGVLTILQFLCCTTGNARPAPLNHQSRSKVEYANAYKSLMIAYRDGGNKIMFAPLPPKSVPKEQRRAAVLKQIRSMEKFNRQYAQRLIRLKPPASYQEIHEATLNFFQVIERSNLQWEKAIVSRDALAQRRAQQEMDTSIGDALNRMQQALKRAGGKSKQLDAVIKELQQGKEQH